MPGRSRLIACRACRRGNCPDACVACGAHAGTYVERYGRWRVTVVDGLCGVCRREGVDPRAEEPTGHTFVNWTFVNDAFADAQRSLLAALRATPGEAA